MVTSSAVNVSNGQQSIQREFKSDGAPTAPKYGELVRQAVEEWILKKWVDCDFTFEQICGRKRWGELDKWPRSEVGRYVSCMVQTKQFQLGAGKKIGATNTYHLL